MLTNESFPLNLHPELVAMILLKDRSCNDFPSNKATRNKMWEYSLKIKDVPTSLSFKYKSESLLYSWIL